MTNKTSVLKPSGQHWPAPATRNNAIGSGPDTAQNSWIERIRAAVPDRNGAKARSGNLIAWIEDWLLDVEQKVLLTAHPLSYFYLHASALLKSVKDIVANRRSLNIPGLPHALEIADIVRLSNQPAGKWRLSRSLENESRMHGQTFSLPSVHKQHTDSESTGLERPVNKWLLAAALSLAERLDLHHPNTLKRIHLDVFAPGSRGRPFSADLQIPPSQGALMIRVRGDSDRISGLDTAIGGISIFQNGIFITQSDDLLPAMAKKYVAGRMNLSGPHRCELSMDRSRIFWSRRQLSLLRYAVLQATAEISGKILRAAAQQNTAPEVLRKIEQTIAGFFDAATLDDALFEALHPGIQRCIRHHFRSLVRVGVSRSDLPDKDPTVIATAHGFQYHWQKAVIEAMLPQGKRRRIQDGLLQQQEDQSRF